MATPCSWVKSVLAAYADGELKSSTAEAVRRHLEQCESCRAHMRLLEESWRLLDETAPSPPAAQGFTQRMMARVVEEKELERMEARLRPHRLRRKVMSSIAGLAAGLALGFAVYSWTGLMQEPVSPREREVSRSVSVLEDIDLLDEIAVIEAMDRLTGQAPVEGGA